MKVRIDGWGGNGKNTLTVSVFGDNGKTAAAEGAGLCATVLAAVAKYSDREPPEVLWASFEEFKNQTRVNAELRQDAITNTFTALALDSLSAVSILAEKAVKYFVNPPKEDQEEIFPTGPGDVQGVEFQVSL